jgi:enoyl-CoA hydratase/carnithine racemase
MSTSAPTTDRVVRLNAPVEDAGLAATFAELDRLERSESCRVILLTIPEGLNIQPASAERLSNRLRLGPRVVVAVLDGEYRSCGVTVAAGADMAVASETSRFMLETDTVGFHESWFADLPLRDLKWLALCAGPLNADSLREDGFLNFVFPGSDLLSKAFELAQNIARIPSDLLTVKKRAHDTRLRLVGSIGR